MRTADLCILDEDDMSVFPESQIFSGELTIYSMALRRSPSERKDVVENCSVRSEYVEQKDADSGPRDSTTVEEAVGRLWHRNVYQTARDSNRR